MGPPDLQPRRDLTLTHATSLVVGITIGTGIFLKSAAMAQAVGTPALVLAAWVAAGVVAMCGALCFAELGALLPDAGGEYVYLRTAFGEIPGFLYACNSFVLVGASIAAYGPGGAHGQRERRPRRLRGCDVRRPVGVQRLAVPAHGGERGPGSATQPATRHHRWIAAGARDLLGCQHRVPVRVAALAGRECQLH